MGPASSRDNAFARAISRRRADPETVIRDHAGYLAADTDDRDGLRADLDLVVARLDRAGSHAQIRVAMILVGVRGGTDPSGPGGDTVDRLLTRARDVGRLRGEERDTFLYLERALLPTPMSTDVVTLLTGHLAGAYVQWLERALRSGTVDDAVADLKGATLWSRPRIREAFHSAVVAEVRRGFAEGREPATRQRDLAAADRALGVIAAQGRPVPSAEASLLRAGLADHHSPEGRSHLLAALEAVTPPREQPLAWGFAVARLESEAWKALMAVAGLDVRHGKAADAIALMTRVAGPRGAEGFREIAATLRDRGELVEAAAALHASRGTDRATTELWEEVTDRLALPEDRLRVTLVRPSVTIRDGTDLREVRLRAIVREALDETTEAAPEERVALVVGALNGMRHVDAQTLESIATRATEARALLGGESAAVEVQLAVARRLPEVLEARARALRGGERQGSGGQPAAAPAGSRRAVGEIEA